MLDLEALQFFCLAPQFRKHLELAMRLEEDIADNTLPKHPNVLSLQDWVGFPLGVLDHLLAVLLVNEQLLGEVTWVLTEGPKTADKCQFTLPVQPARATAMEPTYWSSDAEVRAASKDSMRPKSSWAGGR